PPSRIKCCSAQNSALAASLDRLLQRVELATKLRHVVRSRRLSFRGSRCRRRAQRLLVLERHELSRRRSALPLRYRLPEQAQERIPADEGKWIERAERLRCALRREIHLQRPRHVSTEKFGQCVVLHADHLREQRDREQLRRAAPF